MAVSVWRQREHISVHQPHDVTRRSTARRALLESDKSALDEPRAPAQRAVGACRDFALTLCSFLRATGAPARLRCGFAAYLSDGWEDHWVCEYWDSRNAEWRLSDPQLDDVTRAKCNVTFDPSDMPREVFLTAGEAWLRCRAGTDNSECVGHGDTKGLWFMKVNLVRDAYAVNNRETSEWDRWREASAQFRTVSAQQFPQLDYLARHPEALSGDFTAEWLPGWGADSLLRSHSLIDARWPRAH